MSNREISDSSLRINVTIPVFERVEMEQDEVSLDNVELPSSGDNRVEEGQTTLMPVRGKGDFPNGSTDVRRSIQRKARFQATIGIGHPADPLAYLGLDLEDKNPYLDRNQMSNLMKIYAPDWSDKWVVEWNVDQSNEDSEAIISFAGSDQDFIECAEKNAQESLAGETPSDVLLAWMEHPYFDEGRIKSVLVDYKPRFRNRFR